MPSFVLLNQNTTHGMICINDLVDTFLPEEDPLNIYMISGKTSPLPPDKMT